MRAVADENSVGEDQTEGVDNTFEVPMPALTYLLVVFFCLDCFDVFAHHLINHEFIPVYKHSEQVPVKHLEIGLKDVDFDVESDVKGQFFPDSFHLVDEQ